MKLIGRRTFLSAVFHGILSTPAFAFLPNDSLSDFAAAASGGKDIALHYKPLNGNNLEDIARRKMHHGNGRFINPLAAPRNGRIWELLRWKLFSVNQFRPNLADQRVIPLSVNWAALRDHRGLSITYLKHAGIMIKDEDRYWLVDPVFSDMFWFIEDFSPLAFDIADMPKPNEILITHGHYDHLDIPSLGAFAKDTHVISPLGYSAEFQALGMQHRTQLDWFDAYHDHQREVVLLPCNHWTMRSPIEGPNTSLWGSFIFRAKNGYTIYISGDTAYFDGFEQIGAMYDIDLAIINLGAYEPRWFMAPSHMNPKEVVRAFKELRAKKLIIAHWGTFRLGDEPVHFPPLALRKELDKEGLLDHWIDLKHGRTYFAT